ncbi:MAG TPA: acyl-CoA dehydrogenase [Algoriphagus sp.]|jgi:glutaryl-CoA dehydrogenase|uniref:acyl-CoA dehydrogenase family protein n=1 Tax=unclassified Algoriphagus TaxID=2641541 RepID=UPI000C4FC3D6|nr:MULTISPECIES: acyl-CoA dehydrogenase family protein [unclassified Algoriphagus]MAL13648.1 acyl-CoA dehydrogenase [Algoriphagus sp.]QYH39977.1 acyl-CoA dehydrogenase [Algoriphagus sp. NBT04N3]HAD52010.1 acyl-CoA dehydrogenase [Algoriphagus sp.]HAH37300.1 acyl-CoA dehydrogenase [Algoriphagus sp.]HAS58367.1 acyl-CoA dehydrogenase [Algoriphagus sp.]|tara:strand:+ start:202 stop:1560 length:1359 start_codon:yes stop_codon:yes gene_type:complete
MKNLFKNISGLRQLLKSVDLDQISKLSQKVDLPKMVGLVSQMSESDISKMMGMLKGGGKPKEIPPINGDFYELGKSLPKHERDIQLRVREFMESEIKPIANDYWNRGEFPMHIIPKMAELDIAGLTYQGYGCPGHSALLEGFIAMEMARIDTSISTFFGVQSGLAMGSVYLCGSEAQKQEWLPAMQKLEKIGAFGLTEPEVGSGVAGGLTTTCKREGDVWILNGQKKWIGNATFSDMTVIWARDLDDNQVKGFIVRKDNPGFFAEKLEDKMALRTVQNALITLTKCEVPESDRLQEANSFRDTAKVLRMTRAGVAWQAVGCARGAYELALAYSNERSQFGRPIASFQLVQDLLVTMLGDLTAMQTMVFRLSQMQDAGDLLDEHASLAKVFCTLRMRSIVDQARELFGGNGILLRHDIARFVADAEAVYSYEGTKEINSLIVGRAITGHSAFV